MSYLLAIDQGTSSSRAVVYDDALQTMASAQQEFPQIYPKPGWVEHDPEAIWESVRHVIGQCVDELGVTDFAGIGITNQRETTLIWDRASGACVYNAVVWQDRRTAQLCERLRADGAGQMVVEKTGLRLDPYFSATKIAWLLQNAECL